MSRSVKTIHGATQDAILRALPNDPRVSFEIMAQLSANIAIAMNVPLEDYLRAIREYYALYINYEVNLQ